MEIAPGVHQVPLRHASGFLVAEERLTLIDAGATGSLPRLRRYLDSINRSLDELDRVICTHGHPDHIGGLREILSEREEVDVLLHPDDLAGLSLGLREALAGPGVAGARRGRLIQLLTPAPSRATPMHDGDVIGVLGGLEVVHTPGHTPGSVCLYAARHRLLFTGDVLQVLRGRLTYASTLFSHDVAQARASVDRLASLDVGAIALSHYPPWRLDPQVMLRRLATRAVTG